MSVADRPVNVGSISYSLYLIHVPIFGQVYNLGCRFVSKELMGYLLVPASLLVCIPAAWLFYQFIERPSQRLASRIKYRRPAPDHG
ncbi:MAG: hypothetical protein R3F11_28305 [Verrucomicrobiales bacterium]